MTRDMFRHVTNLPYADANYPCDYGAGVNHLIQLEDKDDGATKDDSASCTTSWRRCLALQSHLHEILREGERKQIADEVNGSSTSAPATSSSSTSRSRALQTGIVIPPYQHNPTSTLNTAPNIDRPSVHTVHAAALIEYIMLPIKQMSLLPPPSAAASVATSTSSPPIRLTSHPLMLEAFARQLCEIYDRHIYALASNRQAEELKRQGSEYFHPYPLWEPIDCEQHQTNSSSSSSEPQSLDDSMDDVAISFKSHSGLSSSISHYHRPETYLYDPPVLTFNVPIVPFDSIRSMVELLRRSDDVLSDVRLQSIAIRSLGILSLRDENRALMVSTGAVAHAFDRMRCMAHEPTLIQNASWSQVIFTRPLGACEGATFFHPLNMRNLAVDAAADLNNPTETGPQFLHRLIRMHSHRPNVLTKIFWSIVNLSITPEKKDAVVASGIIQLVCQLFVRHMTHRDLICRASFCLFNLIMLQPVQSILVANNFLSHLVTAMERYPYNWTFQRSGVPIIRAMAHSGQPIKETPGLIPALLRLYLASMPNSLSPNPDTRELILLAIEHTGSSVQREMIEYNERAERMGTEPLQMIVVKEALNHDGTTATSFSSNQTSAASSSSTSSASNSISSPPAAPAPVSLDQLNQDRIAVERATSMRRLNALIDWHVAQMGEEEQNAQREADAEEDADDPNGPNSIHPLSHTLFGQPLSRALFMQSMQAMMRLRNPNHQQGPLFNPIDEDDVDMMAHSDEDEEIDDPDAIEAELRDATREFTE